MAINSVELVIHPVRLRILQSLESGEKTTQEIADRLPDVPKSSLYRHLRLLLEGEFVIVAEIRLVQGIQEKVYELSRPARLGAEDVADLTADDHLRYFTTYLMTVLRGFSDYLSESGEIDFIADRVGYSEVSFWATGRELDEFAAQLNRALTPLLENLEGEGRRRRKLAVIGHPLLAQGIRNV
ncbi:MAG: helix-turn-helix domain-containing protein [Chloroflexota bacterium]|nr:MAG: helix-turn-helix domain-containing protein [Chloroflexota bacterium]